MQTNHQTILNRCDGKMVHLFVSRNHYEIMNSFECVEKIKCPIYVCKAFPIYLLLIFKKEYYFKY
jgi:hypothetical protein